MLGAALSKLDELLSKEEKALIRVDLETVVALAGPKTELVHNVEEELAALNGELPSNAVDLARTVHNKAHRNKFLLNHLRSCLRVVNPAGESSKTYGRDGRTTLTRAGGMVRVRL